DYPHCRGTHQSHWCYDLTGDGLGPPYYSAARELGTRAVLQQGSSRCGGRQLTPRQLPWLPGGGDGGGGQQETSACHIRGLSEFVGPCLLSLLKGLSHIRVTADRYAICSEHDQDVFFSKCVHTARCRCYRRSARPDVQQPRAEDAR